MWTCRLIEDINQLTTLVAMEKSIRMQLTRASRPKKTTNLNDITSHPPKQKNTGETHVLPSDQQQQQPQRRLEMREHRGGHSTQSAHNQDRADFGDFLAGRHSVFACETPTNITKKCVATIVQTHTRARILSLAPSLLLSPTHPLTPSLTHPVPHTLKHFTCSVPHSLTPTHTHTHTHTHVGVAPPRQC